MTQQEATGYYRAVKQMVNNYGGMMRFLPGGAVAVARGSCIWRNRTLRVPYDGRINALDRLYEWSVLNPVLSTNIPHDAPLRHDRSGC